MLQQDYPRRPSFGSSLPSSNYTEGYTCLRQNCHCEAANREEIGPDDSISSRSLSSERRHAEYFYRPPILSTHREQLISNGSPYSFFAYSHDPNAEAEHCEQCQFCSASSKWCGRKPALQIAKRRPLLDDAPLYTGLYGAPFFKNMKDSSRLKVQLPNATWVQDPLIVNPAHISFVDENRAPRDQPFQPAVFTHTLNEGPSTAEMDRNPSIDTVLHASQHNLSVDNPRKIRTVAQYPAEGADCLKSYRDVRSTELERLMIEEGSIVVSISPKFTDLSKQLIAPDEFELRIGEVFVVARMYADMWALCIRLSNTECVADADVDDLNDSPNIKFIPLCSVTLASNFAPFTRRCACFRADHPYSKFFPAGGDLITPPDRHESLEASRKYFSKPERRRVPVPPMVYSICHAHKVMQPGLNYILRDDETESLDHGAEAVVDTHAKNQHHRTLRRFWSMFTTKQSDSSAGGKQPETSEHNLGLDSDGRSLYPIRSREEGPDDGESADDRHGNGHGISKRKSVRNFFSRSVRVKNGNTAVEV